MPRRGDTGALVDALLRELDMRREEVVQPVTTLYLGGGTPSSLPVDDLQHLVDGLKERVDLSRLEEFTIEVNPEDVTAGLVDALTRMGVNRVSMGIQSLNDAELQAVGRRHSASTALDAMDVIAARIPNYSVDLIFGLPGQTLETLSTSLDTIIERRPPHVSVYLLSYEPGTLLWTRLQQGKVTETPDETATEMYHLVTSRLAAAGYLHYEISNYSLPGMHSRHNSSYWDFTPYLGLGPSAHSFDGTTRRYNPSSIKKYLDTINQGSICYIEEPPSLLDRFNDLIITTLRTSRGLDLASLEGKWPREMVETLEREAAPLVARGALTREGCRLTIPHERWLTADDVMRQLIIAE